MGPASITRVGEGEPLVLVHGDFSTGADAWQRQIAGITDRMLLVVDRPGYGNEASDQAAFTVDGDAASILQALDELGVERFDLAGHSYGGLVAAALARRAGERTRSLLLIEPPLLGLLPHSPAVQALIADVERVRRDAADQAAETVAEAFFTMLAGPGAPDRLRLRPEWDAIVRTAPRFARSQSPGSYPVDAFFDLPALLPVSIMTGTRSHPALQEVARAVAVRLPGARLAAVEGAGHAVQFAAAEFMATLVELDQRARSAKRG